MNSSYKSSSLKHKEKGKQFFSFLPQLAQQFRLRPYIFYLPLILAILCLLTLFFIPVGNGEIPALAYFFGRFHPLIVHFPIVLILLVLVFEGLSRTTGIRISSGLKVLLLIAAALSSFISVLAGFLLYYTGEYTGEVMQLHKWAGIGVGLGIFLTLLLYLAANLSKSTTYDVAYLIALGTTNAILFFASHQGGSLTHGTEYLTEYMPQWFEENQATALKPLEEMIIYEDILVPVMDAKCMSCHNENKTKGDLMMTTYQGLMEGGKSDMAAVIPHDAENSGLYYRVTLPETDDDHMPPEGKTPLTNNEKFLLKWWIDVGASPVLTVQEAGMDSVTQTILGEYLAELTALQVSRLGREKEKEAVMEIARQLEEELNVVIQTDVETRGEYVNVSMQFPPAVFGDEQLLQLAPLFPKIAKLSLVGSNITDDGLYHISKMTNLKHLILQQTPVKGPGLVYLTHLPHLEQLNLSKTEIDDAGILFILKMPSLKTIHLNQTQVSEPIVKALQKNNPDLQLQLDRGNFF